eukprot:gnl/TRDRNA2_/TRDRNA2_153506_c0_seq3.p1 gnl/TRDRNA2_/TRDRNA2_153506_c0~~gnl/TRDRNA2_/TRDRNA2_153506_c0_seq3.p1  ORF type:complete len:741 (-),score=210.01 gnl/TRDRNA2_/TRDRNA2_153506_c0_seq3:311-2533(-)
MHPDPHSKTTDCARWQPRLHQLFRDQTSDSDVGVLEAVHRPTSARRPARKRHDHSLDSRDTAQPSRLRTSPRLPRSKSAFAARRPPPQSAVTQKLLSAEKLLREAKQLIASQEGRRHTRSQRDEEYLRWSKSNLEGLEAEGGALFKRLQTQSPEDAQAPPASKPLPTRFTLDDSDDDFDEDEDVQDADTNLLFDMDWEKATAADNADDHRGDMDCDSSVMQLSSLDRLLARLPKADAVVIEQHFARHESETNHLQKVINSYQDMLLSKDKCESWQSHCSDDEPSAEPPARYSPAKEEANSGEAAQLAAEREQIAADRAAVLEAMRLAMEKEKAVTEEEALLAKERHEIALARAALEEAEMLARQQEQLYAEEISLLRLEREQANEARVAAQEVMELARKQEQAVAEEEAQLMVEREQAAAAKKEAELALDREQAATEKAAAQEASRLAAEYERTAAEEAERLAALQKEAEEAQAAAEAAVRLAAERREAVMQKAAKQQAELLARQQQHTAAKEAAKLAEDKVVILQESAAEKTVVFEPAARFAKQQKQDPNDTDWPVDQCKKAGVDEITKRGVELGTETWQESTSSAGASKIAEEQAERKAAEEEAPPPSPMPPTHVSLSDEDSDEEVSSSEDECREDEDGNCYTLEELYKASEREGWTITKEVHWTEQELRKYWEKDMHEGHKAGYRYNPDDEKCYTWNSYMKAATTWTRPITVPYTKQDLKKFWSENMVPLKARGQTR